MKRILVIGSSGLLGSHLVKALQSKAEVIGASFHSAELKGDIADPASLKSLIQRVGIVDAIACTEGTSSSRRMSTVPCFARAPPIRSLWARSPTLSEQVSPGLTKSPHSSSTRLSRSTSSSRAPCCRPGCTWRFMGGPRGLEEEQPLGEFEQIVLLAVLRLGKNAYGVTTWEEIERRTGRSVMIGAVYATPDRLEAKRYFSSKLGDPTPERGGRAKRFFKVTAQGSEALERSRKILAGMWAGLDPLLGE